MIDPEQIREIWENIAQSALTSGENVSEAIDAELDRFDSTVVSRDILDAARDELDGLLIMLENGNGLFLVDGDLEWRKVRLADYEDLLDEDDDEESGWTDSYGDDD